MVSRGAQFIDGTRCELDGPVAAGSLTACLNGKCKVMSATLRRESSLCKYFIQYCKVSNTNVLKKSKMLT